MGKQNSNKKTSNKSLSSVDIQSNLKGILSSSLSKKNKDFDPVIELTDVDISNVKYWVSTGSKILDLIISNRKNAGLPSGRIVEIHGLEGTGKSLLAAHILSETQRMGGMAIYIDTESAVSDEFMRAIGVDISSLLYLSMECIEDILESIDSIITDIRSENLDIPVTIIVDSVMGATTKIEMESGYDKDGYATQKAIILSKALRKLTKKISTNNILLVMTNQMRVDLTSGMFGDKYTTSGGKGIPFHSSVRIRLKNLGKIKNAKKDVIGNKVGAEIIKNRIGPPHKKMEFDIYYDIGLDKYSDIFNIIKLRQDNMSKIRKSGSFFIVDYNNEEIKFRSSNFKEVLDNNEGLIDYLYDIIYEELHSEYKNNIDNTESYLGNENIELDYEDISEI